jgi:hypothetical protein
MTPRVAIALSCTAVFVAALVASIGFAAPVARSDEEGDGERTRAECPWPPREFPSEERVRAAVSYARGRGTVGFAVIDGCGGVRGYEKDRQFSGASITKALLLAAFLRDNEHPTDSERSTLESMITYSDNDAGNAIYAEVRDAGLTEVARRAGMRDFISDPGFWGGTQVTAADMARFFFRLDDNLAGPGRELGKRLLTSIVSSQRWGIPAAAGGDWRVWFKGGWRPLGEEQTTGPVTHQAALLEHSSGVRVAIAVLSDDPPGGESYSTIEGITERLLSPSPRPRIWVPA